MMKSGSHATRAFRMLTISVVVFGAALSILWPTSSTAAIFRNLRVFNTEGAKGRFPYGSLVRDEAGHLFGGTVAGGTHDHGVIFQFTYVPGRDRWQEKVIYNFCALANCVDGASPSTSLIRDVSGNLYGTAGGGSTGSGVVFELSPAKHGNWKYKVLWNACTESSNCQDGSGPWGLSYAGQQNGEPFDGVSPLYGVTLVGNKGTRGVAYSLTRNTDGSWTQKVLYAFCSKGGSSCTDGLYPNGDLMMDSAGNLYGTTQMGGAKNVGLVFKLTPGPKLWTETVLHDFCSEADCRDGATPASQTMTMDSGGTIYGTTTFGGRQSDDCLFDGAGGCGLIYKITPDGTESTLYLFCSRRKCIDGAQPMTGLLIDGTGALYGTTDAGGYRENYAKGGTIFRIDAGGKLETLFSLGCNRDGCKNGRDAGGTLIQDGTGNLFGVMSNAGLHHGAQGQGTVFELTP